MSKDYPKCPTRTRLNTFVRNYAGQCCGFIPKMPEMVFYSFIWILNKKSDKELLDMQSNFGKKSLKLLRDLADEMENKQ